MRDCEYTVVSVHPPSPESENQPLPRPQNPPPSGANQSPSGAGDQPCPEAQNRPSSEAADLPPSETRSLLSPQAENSPSPESEISDHDEKDTAKKLSCLPQGWRRTVLAGSLAALLVLIINVVFLAWTLAKFPLEGGVATIYTGSCSVSKAISTWSHLGINVLGTLLLAASNSCMQVLVSPTRAEVDAAHHKRQWLDVGTQTLRNMKFIGRRRMALWAVLGLSSVPLHLLYNSVIVSSTATNMYNVYTVTNNFFTDKVWNKTLPVDDPSDCAAAWAIRIWDIQRDYIDTPYDLLQPEECIKRYSQRQNDYGNLLLVTNEVSNDTIVRVLSMEGGVRTYSNNWFCETQDSGIYNSNCDIDARLADVKSNGWRLPGYRDNITRPRSTPTNSTHTNWCLPVAMDPDYMFPIDHCLAKHTSNTCSVFAAVTLLWVVVGCNILKFSSLLVTLYGLKTSPLITIGDAMDSFLGEVDETTADAGLLSARTIEAWVHGHDRDANTAAGSPWRRKKRSGLSAVSRCRWVLYNISFVTAIIVTFIYLDMAIVRINEISSGDRSLREIFALGLGKTLPGVRIGMDVDGDNLAGNLLLFSVIANSPQLIVSILYMAYNDVFTRMAMACEWASFYRHDGRKQPLRVSRPRGHQRSTSFLQMPFWWSVPIMAMMTCLHWAISQSIFLVIEEEADYSQHLPVLPEDIGVKNQAVSFSPLGILLSAALGILMILVLWLASGLIKLTAGMPVVRSNSVAISAACHRPSWDDDVAIKLVSWGVLGEERGVQRVGFSSGETRPLQDGVVYSN